MKSLKIRLLIGIIFCVAIFLFVWLYFASKQIEPVKDILTQSTAQETVTPDPKFDRTSHDDKLQAETDALLPLFDRMPSVPIYLKDDPMLKTGTNTERSAAFTLCDKNHSPSIFMKNIYFQKANRIQLINSLKHELTHAWLCRQHLMSVGHNEVFRKKFSQVGGWGN